MNSISIKRYRQQGVSLLEALVALVVLSIGMLGISALYVETMRANRTALTRMQAVGLVSDMADRIRANPLARVNYGMAAWGGAPATHDCVAGGSNCSFAALAEDDLARWRASVMAILPNAQVPEVEVTSLASGLDSYRIRVSWLEPGETAVMAQQEVFEMIPVTLPLVGS